MQFVTEGLTHGFDIGFHGPCVATRLWNSLSPRENPGEVSKAIQKELIRGHTSGPFAEPSFTQTHCSPIGAVGKPDGSYRLILDLSSPRGEAVNEGIDRQEFSVTYSQFDDAIDIVHALGRGAYMAKIDIRHMFCICQVRKAQWLLLCYWWQGAFFVDTRLLFGLRSSPYIFTALAELLLWILIHVMGMSHCIHYLDDYFCASVTQGQYQRDMRTLMATCDDLGVPLVPDRIIGPTRTLTYLGIQIDTERMMVSLPAEKFDKLAVQWRTWGTRKKCTKRELLSLIGALSFAAKVVKPGRMFLQRLIDLSTTVSKLDHRVSLNVEALADIEWWTTFLPLWNGVELIQESPVTSHSLQFYTDASDQGFGTVYGKRWLFSPWRGGVVAQANINVRKLFAIIAAVLAWGEGWRNKQMVIHTDSLVITCVWRTGTSRDEHVMGLVRFLFTFLATCNMNLYMSHIPGLTNRKADALSCLQFQDFHKCFPDAEQHPTPVLPGVWNIFR